MNEENLFHRALELPAAERAAFLELACAGDPKLQARLEALLQAHAQPGSFLQERAVTLPAETPSSTPGVEAAGTRIGVYKLIEPIGEGGMGSVWLAEQLEPVKRLVALKLIKEGLDSARVIARFEAERQALALMDHPNIAKVFDAGTTTTGRPYFVMELVKGVAITKYCDEQRLTPRQRLELFIPVCQAVQHAHQKGIIHRDLKPSNVLIALYDGQPVPKVIDFGIAKATGDPLTERTLHTGFGAIVGTLEYMSPEQAEPNQLDIDTRSDVYSLGVMLYELLTGSTPLDRKRLQDAAIWELLRVIREVEPPKPSTRLSSSEALPALSAQRQMEPARLARLLRGELDWIVMKALEKDRQRRYETASGLAEDVSRYLRDEPVRAGPPSVAYRLRKFVKRNKGVVLAATLIVLALLGGAIGTSIGMLRALDAEATALDARDDADNHKRSAEKARDAAVAARDDALASRQRAEQKEKDASYARLRADTARHALQMEAAGRAYASDDLVEATRILDAVPAAFRTTWEYRHLRSVSRRKAVPLGADAAFYWPGIFSPDGKSFAASNGRHLDRYADNKPKTATIKIWDVATGAETGHIPQPGRPGPFTQDGKRLFIIDAQHVQLYEVATGKVLAAFPCTDGACFGGDKRLLAQDGDTMKVWDVATGNVLHAYKSWPWKEAAQTIASPDGERLAFFTGYNPVVVCDVNTGNKLFTVQRSETPFGRLAFSPDSKSIVIGSDSWAKVFDATTGKLQLTLIDAPQVLATSPTTVQVAYSPDGKTILTAWPGVVKTWSAATGKEKLHLDLKPGLYLRGATFTPDSESIVGWLGGQTADLGRRFDAESGKEQPFPQLSSFQGYDGSDGPVPEHYVFSPDGQRVVSRTRDGVLVWNMAFQEAAQELYRLELPQGNSVGGGFTAHDRHIYLWNDQRSGTWNLHRWHTATGQAEPTLQRNFGGLFPRWLSADGTQVYCSREAPLFDVKGWKIFDVASMRVLASAPVEVGSRVSFSPDGKLFATGKPLEHRWRIWEARSGRELHAVAVKDNQYTVCFAFSPDSQRFAAGNARGTVSIYTAQTGTELATIQEDPTAQIAFLPDGQRLISYLNFTVNVWDVPTGKLSQSFREVRPSQLIYYSTVWVYFVLSPDGTRLVVGNRLYDVATGQHVFTIRPGPHFLPGGFSRDGRYLRASDNGKAIVLDAP